MFSDCVFFSTHPVGKGGVRSPHFEACPCIPTGLWAWKWWEQHSFQHHLLNPTLTGTAKATRRPPWLKKNDFYLLADPSISNHLLSFPCQSTAHLENWRKEGLPARRHSHMLLWTTRGTHPEHRSPSRPAITSSVLHAEEFTRGRNLGIFSMKALNSHGSAEYHCSASPVRERHSLLYQRDLIFGHCLYLFQRWTRWAFEQFAGH